MDKVRLSAVILSHNAQSTIAKCLASLSGWADEIIVVDGQSSDETVNIARQFGARVFSHAFLGSFAEERNFGTEQANGDWILQLDSDEVISEEFKKKCAEILAATTCVAFKFRRKNYFLGRSLAYGGFYHFSQHLFRKGFAYYEGRVHERMVVRGGVGEIDADILHFPFDNLNEFIERQNRYTSLQASDIIDEYKDLSIAKVRYNLTWKPLKLFKKMYLNKKGYKEGVHGLVFIILFCFVHFLKWAKVWERLYKENNT
jgi:glycosyltransferase involved in cell wall biosynthesis